jgi:hypothetical protein
MDATGSDAAGSAEWVLGADMVEMRTAVKKSDVAFI